MKATIQAKIKSVTKKETLKTDKVDMSGMTRLSLESISGKVETQLNTAQLVALLGDLYLREVIANQIKIGATITLTVTDEGADESST